MTVKQQTISEAEWQVMKTVWTIGDPTAKQIVEVLQKQEEWSPSTVKTLIGRLVKKGFLTHQVEEKPYTYHTDLNEETAMINRAESLFGQLCDRKKGHVINDLVSEVEMSVDDLKRLETIIQQKISTAPQEVECECLEVR